MRIIHWRRPLALGSPSREFILTRAPLSRSQADLVLFLITKGVREPAYRPPTQGVVGAGRERSYTRVRVSAHVQNTVASDKVVQARSDCKAVEAHALRNVRNRMIFLFPRTTAGRPMSRGACSCRRRPSRVDWTDQSRRSIARRIIADDHRSEGGKT
jgi:hypothetical protein